MLVANEITALYGDSQALWDISLKINQGEIVTLIGPNGAGKSTIMKIIAGFVKPATGTITFNGTELNRLPTHKIVDMGISLVPEGRRLFPAMTVMENLEVGASTKAGRRNMDASIEWVFSLFPILKDRTRQIAGTLSGGQQQMLAISRALMAKPKLLLIDEMSLGLSPIVVEDILSVLMELNKTKKLTIALVEQDVDAALSVADRGYIVDHGRLVAEGESNTLRNDDRIMQAYLCIQPSDSSE